MPKTDRRQVARNSLLKSRHLAPVLLWMSPDEAFGGEFSSSTVTLTTLGRPEFADRHGYV
jgi:hypothetical protein